MKNRWINANFSLGSLSADNEIKFLFFYAIRLKGGKIDANCDVLLVVDSRFPPAFAVKLLSSTECHCVSRTFTRASTEAGQSERNSVE